MTTFTEEVDLTEHHERSRRRALELMKEDSQGVLEFLMRDEGLLPDCLRLEEILNEHGKDFNVSDMLPVALMDEAGNEIQHFSQPDELRNLTRLTCFKGHLQLNQLILLKEIVFNGIKAGRLSDEILIDFLEKRTWLGQKMASPRPRCPRLEYRWVDLVSPAIQECFQVFEREMAGKPFSTQCVLALDSLTLKMEGLFRAFCGSHGITTFCSGGGRSDRQVFKEKDLNYLLRDEAFDNIVNSSDLLFFKLLLIEQAGYNLRNKIAHCLMASSELYSPDYVYLMILALLRLSKYPLGEGREIPT